jgi:aminomethyltransferase
MVPPLDATSGSRAARRTMHRVESPQAAAVDLRATPLDAVHRALGAKMGPFAGWLMPIEYEGALAEHRAVRERVGLFDLTHLGKVEVTGPGALGMLQRVVTNDLSRAAVGEAQYNLVLNEGGGVIEDLIVYRLDAERYFVVPNAANAQRVLQALEAEPADDRVHLVYHQDWCFLAVQGPGSVRVTSELFPEAADLAFMRCVETQYRRRPVILTRSGYTGEIGFELFTYQDVSEALWQALFEAAAPFGGMPCGLGARDVLRLEMGYPLYGQDLFESVTALEAGLGWAVRFDKGDFHGREALVRQRDQGLPTRLCGLVMEERRRIPRAHHPVMRADDIVGEVTSGTFSPVLERGIALAYLWPADVADVGDTVEVDVRGRRGSATLARPPFVDRSPR